MSTSATPRISSTSTPRANTNQSRNSFSSNASFNEQKTKGSGNVTARGGSEATQISTSVIAEEADILQLEEEKEPEPEPNLPFFRQDPYTDVVLQVRCTSFV